MVFVVVYELLFDLYPISPNILLNLIEVDRTVFVPEDPVPRFDLLRSVNNCLDDTLAICTPPFASRFECGDGIIKREPATPANDQVQYKMGAAYLILPMSDQGLKVDFSLSSKGDGEGIVPRLDCDRNCQ